MSQHVKEIKGKYIQRREAVLKVRLEAGRARLQGRQDYDGTCKLSPTPEGAVCMHDATPHLVKLM